MPTLHYRSEDHDFLSRALVFNDPDRDGTLTTKESENAANASYRKFTADVLTRDERAILAGFTVERPLCAELFAAEPELARIAGKALAFKQTESIIQANGLPENIDAAKLAFDLEAQAGHLFNRLTVDTDEIRANLDSKLWRTLMRGDLSAYPTGTLLVLRHLIKQNRGQQSFAVSFEEWRTAFRRIVGNGGTSTPDSTWNEMLILWQESDPECHWFWDAADWALSKTTGGYARLGQPDLTIRARGLQYYLKAPGEFVYPNPAPAPGLPASPLKRALTRWETEWPMEQNTRITLAKAAGVSFNLDVAPIATAAIRGRVARGDLRFRTAEPLLALDGFSFNIDASHWLTRAVDRAGDAVLGLISKDFDVETLKPVAVTVFKNRLALVITGERNSRDLVKPAGDDTLFLDLTPFVRAGLAKLDPSGDIAAELFDANGDIYSRAELSDLTDAVLRVLQSSTVPTTTLPVPLGKFPPTDQWQNRVYAQDLTANIPSAAFQAFGNAASSAPVINNAVISDGKLYGEGRLPGDFRAQGVFNLDMNVTGIASPLHFSGEVLADSAQSAGYVRLQLDPTALKGIAGAFSGEILVGIELTAGDLSLNGLPSPDELLKSLVVKALIRLDRDHKDYLTAAAKLKSLSLDPASGKLRRVLADYDLVLSGDERLFGVIHDGAFDLTLSDPANPHLAGSIGVAATRLIGGGLARLFGDHAVVTVAYDRNGRYYLRPAVKALALAVGPAGMTARDVTGEMIITPPPPGGDEFTIDLANLALTVSDAEIRFGERTARGEIKAGLSGQWRVKAKTWGDLLEFNDAWHGSGTLHLKGAPTRLTYYDATARVMAASETPSLESVIQVTDMVFKPLRLAHDAVTRVKSASFAVDTPLISMAGDVDGSVRLKGNVPLVRFMTAQAVTRNGRTLGASPADIPPLDPPRLPKGSLPLDFDETGFLGQLLLPVIGTIMNEPNSAYDLAYFVSDRFPKREFGDSIEDARLRLGLMPINSVPDPKSENGEGRLPFFSGWLKFLNPRLAKGTGFTTPDEQTLADDGRLHDFTITLNHPVHFLGLEFTGVGVSHPRCFLKDRTRRHIYLFTRKGRIELMTLMRLRYPCKVAQVYRNLRREGMDIRPNEVPSDLADLARFLDEILAVFGVKDDIIANDERQANPFAGDEFKTLSRSQRQSVREALEKLGLPTPVPAKGGWKSLHAYVNAAGKDLTLAHAVKEHLELFDPEDAEWAGDYIDEILLIEFLNEGRDPSVEETARIIRNNYLIMHLLLKRRMENAPIIAISDIRDLHVNATLKPVKADYEIVTVNKDATEPFAMEFAYNPVIGKPGLYVNAATANDDFMANMSFRYKSSSLWLKSDFHRLGSVAYYLAPAVHGHETDYSVHAADYDAANVEATYMPPSPFNRPSFTVFSPPDPNIAMNNHVRGAELYADSFADDVSFRLSIDKAYAANSYLYFYLGGEGDEKDILIDAANAVFTGVTADTSSDYDNDAKAYLTSLTAVAGRMNIDNLPAGKPRALFYLGTDTAGKRRYLVVNRLEAKGGFNVEDDALELTAHVGFLAILPDSIANWPVFEELHAKGVDFNIRAVELDGSLTLVINDTKAGISKATQIPDASNGRDDDLHAPALQSLSKIPPSHVHSDTILLKLIGSFRFRVADAWVTITDLTVPLDEFMLRLIKERGLMDLEIASATLASLIVPANDNITSGIELTVQLPPTTGGSALKIRDGKLDLRSSSPLVYAEKDGSPYLTTDGLKVSVNDSANSLNLSTGVITYVAGAGEVKNWTLDAKIRQEIYQGVVEILLSGEALGYGVK